MARATTIGLLEFAGQLLDFKHTPNTVQQSGAFPTVFHQFAALACKSPGDKYLRYR